MASPTAAPFINEGSYLLHLNTKGGSTCLSKAIYATNETVVVLLGDVMASAFESLLAIIFGRRYLAAIQFHLD